MLLVVALAYLIHEGHGNMFFYDEWGWIEDRRNGLSTILDSYNQHMEIVPLAVYQLFLHTVGLNHYHWYRLLAALGHLSVVTALYCFARSRIGPLALVIAVPLAFFGAGWEFILWGVNFGFTISIALAVSSLIWLESDTRSSLIGCGLMIASLLFSETALLFSVGLAVELTWRDRSLRRFWVWALPIVLYLAWYVGFYQPYLSEHNVSSIPTFGARLAAAASGGMFGASAYGGLFGVGIKLGWGVLILIAGLLVFRLLRRSALTPRLIAVLLTVLGYWTLVAFGRAQLGDPNASRYVYSGAVLLLLVILESLRGIEVNWRSSSIVAVLSIIALIGGLKAFHGGESSLYVGSTSEASEVTALRLMQRFVPPTLTIDPHWSPQITGAAYFPAAADLPGTGALTLAQLLVQPEGQRASADLVLLRGGDLTVTNQAPASGQNGTGASVEFQVGGRLSRSAGCVRFAPSGAGSTLDLALPATGLVIHALAGAGPAAQPPTAIRVRRFASSFDNDPVVSLTGNRTVLIHPRADAAPQPWHVRISPWETVIACTVGGR